MKFKTRGRPCTNNATLKNTGKHKPELTTNCYMATRKQCATKRMHVWTLCWLTLFQIMACCLTVPCHMNQRYFIVNWRNNLPIKMKQFPSIQRNYFENFVCKGAASFSWAQCIKGHIAHVVTQWFSTDWTIKGERLPFYRWRLQPHKCSHGYEFVISFHW